MTWVIFCLLENRVSSKGLDIFNQNFKTVVFCLLEEWDAGYGGLVSDEHPRGDLVTVHPPPLAKDAGK